MPVRDIATRLRRDASVLETIAVTVVLLGGHLAVVAAIQDAGGVTPLDARVHEWFVEHRAALLDPVMIEVSAIGGTAGMATLAVVAAVFLVRYGRRAHAAIVLIGCTGGEVLGEGAKLVYQRARPPEADRLVAVTSYALPSGHSLLATVTVGIVAAAAVLVISSRAGQAGVVAFSVAVVLLIGTSRVYLGVHWPTDVLSGYLLGGAWLAVCVLGLIAVERRRATVGTDAPTVALPVVSPAPASAHLQPVTVPAQRHDPG